MLVLQDEADSGPESSQMEEDSPDSSQQGTADKESDREVGGRWCLCKYILQAASGVRAPACPWAMAPCVTTV